MAMPAERVVALCELAAHNLKEDLHLIESGSLEIRIFGQDVTTQHEARLRAHLSRVMEIIDGCGCQCA